MTIASLPEAEFDNYILIQFSTNFVDSQLCGTFILHEFIYLLPVLHAEIYMFSSFRFLNNISFKMFLKAPIINL